MKEKINTLRFSGRITQKKISIIILSSLFLIFSVSVFAMDDDKKKDEAGRDEKFFLFEAGIKLSSTEQSSNVSSYYKPFAEATFQLRDFSITPSYAAYLHYQITDGYKKYSLIKFNQFGIASSFNINEDLEIKGELKANSGEQNFKGYEFSMEAAFDIENFSFSAGFGKNSNKYTFLYPQLTVKEREIENAGYSVSLGIDYYTTEKTILNADFDIKQSEYIYNAKLVQDQEYTQHMLRLGVSHKVNRNILLMIGLDGGKDSADYRIVGADIGIKLKLMEHVKLSASAMILYNKAPASSGTASSSKKSNPFSPSTDSFQSRSIGLGASLFF